ncbi:hypothetical protein MNBD_ALPHA05-1381 [hydrothermal vent metagenome]|uniref:Uncharacterized protein n=1 Tax=hydrothermal vent metagenome TaxID=652676 RepID=A0A3B0SHA2_9ZZZZ
MQNNSFLVHLILAVCVSFGISIYVWVQLDIFNLAFFWIVSTITAALGAFVGWVVGRDLIATFIVTMLTRAIVLSFAG